MLLFDVVSCFCVSRYSVIRIWRLIERLVTGFLHTDCLLQGVCYKRELYDAHYFLKPLNILSEARSLAMQEHSPNLVYSALKLSHRTHTGLCVGEIYLIKTCILCWDHPQAGQTTESIVFLVMYPLTLSNKIQYPLSVSYQLTIRSVIQSTSRFPSTKTVEYGNASRDIRVHEINFLRNRRSIHLPVLIWQGIYQLDFTKIHQDHENR